MNKQFGALFLLLTALVLFSFHATAQSPFHYLQNTPSTPKDSGSVRLQCNALTFFKNNEYFSPVIKGYTLPGVKASFNTEYSFSQKTWAQAGAESTLYFGDSTFRQVRPIWSINTYISDSTLLTFGRLNDSRLHNLPVFLYNTEQLLLPTSENGIQLTTNKQAIESEVWMNWNSFLYWNEKKQEELYGGASIIKNFLPKKKVSVSTPFFLTAYHKGGQIDSTKLPIQTIINIAGGVIIKHKSSKASHAFRFLVSNYNDQTTKDLRKYKDGTGILAEITGERKHIYYELSYWKGKKYYSPIGEPIYMSLPYDIFSKPTESRELIIPKIYYHKELTTGVKLLTGAEIYYSLEDKQLDYSFSLYIASNIDLLLSK